MAQPRRTCIVCRQVGDKAALLRLARLRADGTVARPRAGFEVGRVAPGRGAYVHPVPCLDRLEARHLIGASTSNRHGASRAAVAQQLGGDALAELRAVLVSMAQPSLSLPKQCGSAITN